MKKLLIKQKYHKRYKKFGRLVVKNNPKKTIKWLRKRQKFICVYDNEVIFFPIDEENKWKIVIDWNETTYDKNHKWFKYSWPNIEDCYDLNEQY